MSFRALFCGLFAAFFIAGAGYINDRILELESFNNGHQAPIIVLGVLLLFIALVNPLLHRLRKRWAFRPGELALIVALSMCSCGISGRALMEQFAQIVVMPFHWNRVTPGWQAHELLSYAPKEALVDPEPLDDVVTPFVMGADVTELADEGFVENQKTRIKRVPWGNWVQPLKTWMPLIVLATLASVALALVVHRQWAHHEHLQYPIAQFTNALIDREEGHAFGPILRNRLFWMGFIFVFAIRLNNGLYRWFPDYLIPIRMSFAFWPVAAKWPVIRRVHYWGMLMRLNVFPLVIAFAFFLNSEVSLTLGLSQILWAMVAIPLVGFGVNLTTDYDIGGWEGWHRAGSYVAFTLMLFYTGRNYYVDLLLKAIGLRRKSQDQRPAEVWAARFLLFSTVAMIILAIRLGLCWPIAVSTVLLMMMTFLIVARLSAETGLFFIQPGWQPFGALIPLFGGYAMGPEAIVISALFCGVLCIDQSQALLPYLVNGLKICDGAKVAPAKAGGITFGMYIAGVVLAIFVVIVATYEFGTPVGYNWSYKRMPTMAFRALEPELMKLKAIGKLEESQSLSGWERIRNIKPSSAFLWAAGSGFVLVLIFAFLRLRVPWWPLHPCLFLIWATYPIAFMSHSFLLGWMVKKACVRFGGNRLVRKLRPLAVGVIAGEIFGALVFMIIGAIYFWLNDLKPISYRYFPR